jgi:hypothetical protein
LAEFVKNFNEEQEAKSKEIGVPPFKLTQRGASSIDLPPNLMISFFQPLFKNIKTKVA